MAPRRPTAPHAGAARARGATRPPAPTRQGPARPAPPARAAGGDRVSTTARAARSPARPSLLIRPVTMLSAVLVVLVLLLAPYVRPWVTQRSQIAAADEQMKQLEQEVEDLTAERRRWDDPAYIRAQARERLYFVMPGETGYVVLDDSTPAGASTDPRDAAVAVPATGGVREQPWYATVWSSVRIAGDPTTEQARSAGGTGASP